MQIQSVSSQPNFKGKVVLNPETTIESIYIPTTMHQKLNDIATLVRDKDYDIFISRNEANPDFFNIAANKTFEEAQTVKEYTVKVQSSVILASIVDAAKDAMEMYEKYIAKGIRE